MFEKKGKLITYAVMTIICIQFVFYWLNLHALLSSPISISITTIIITGCLIVVFGKVCSNNDLVILLCGGGLLALSGIIYHNFGTVMTLYNVVVMLIIFNNVCFEIKYIQMIRFITIVLLSIFLLKLNVEPMYQTIIIHDWKGALINNNTFGVLILALFFHGFLFFDEMIKQNFKKITVLCALTCISIKYIYISDSRSALLAAGLFVCLYLIRVVNLENYRRMLFYIILAVLIAPFLYLYALQFVNGDDFLGKSITTRKTVWESTLNYIKIHPIIGCGSVRDIYMGNGQYTTSAHNLFLGTWKTSGIVPLIVMIRYLLHGKNIEKVSKKNYLSKIAFLCCMLVCTFETMLNDSNEYLFFITLLMTVKDNELEEISNDT